MIQTVKANGTLRTAGAYVNVWLVKTHNQGWLWILMVPFTKLNSGTPTRTKMDEHIDYKVGLFHDIDDVTQTETIPSTSILDQVQLIKPSSAQKSISGYAPRQINSPEEWHHLKWNLQTREPFFRRRVIIRC